MSVTATQLVSGGRYAPYRGASRSHGPVGTLHVKAIATGDATGGSITLRILTVGDEFGFPMIWVPTLISAHDNLAAAENIRQRIGSGAGRVLSSSLDRDIVMRAGFGSLNYGVLEGASPPLDLEGNLPLESSVIFLQWEWDTNTDTKTYTGNVFGPVYDSQAIAKVAELEIGGPLAGPL